MGAFSIRDALPEDAAALISLRMEIFGETNFMLYSPTEYSASSEELSTQIAKITLVTPLANIAARAESTCPILSASGCSIRTPKLR